MPTMTAVLHQLRISLLYHRYRDPAALFLMIYSLLSFFEKSTDLAANNAATYPAQQK